MGQKVLILCATKNNNWNLSENLKGHIEKLDMEAELICLEDLNLPLYTPSKEADGEVKEAKDLTEKLIAANGLILVAPEYNGSIPAVTINAISWVSRSGGEDWRAAFNGKIAVVATHSGGGGAKVCSAMRQQLEHLGSVVLPRPIVTNYSKELNPESAEAIFSQMKKLMS